MRHEDVFERLDPPPGGLARLRARMATRPRAARRVALLAFAIVALALVLFFVDRRSAPDLLAAARQRGDVVALGLAPMPATAVALDTEDRTTTALLEVQTSNPHVAFYWVSSTTWGE